MSKLEQLLDAVKIGEEKGLSKEEILNEFYKGTVCKFYCSVETPSRIYEDMNKNGVSRAEAIRHELTNILEQDKDKYLPQHRAVIEENIKKAKCKSKLIQRINERVRRDGGEFSQCKFTAQVDEDVYEKVNKIIAITGENKSQFTARWLKFGFEKERQHVQELEKPKPLILNINERK